MASELGARKVAYLHVVEPRADQRRDDGKLDPTSPDAAATFRSAFGGPVVAAGGFTGESAEAEVASGTADAVAFGRWFISNPDLPERLRRRAPLNPYQRATFYGGGAAGYTDYPRLP